ncbi:glycosyltransferase [Winogradskyella sp.]|uniref:glycosyltransferase n=1 Tax=Winogradskyella sp. TaxID=1883156 RepID=UPI002611533D|nr:glycosyltransferase [Winogradskyella sp.]
MTLRVMQIIDTLQAGGAERLAVNYANGLIKLGVTSFLCTTRDEGPLRQSIHDKVGYMYLKRRSTFDFQAILKLKQFVKQNKIDIIHAHATSYFISILVKIFVPKVKIIWHDHYGNSELLEDRPKRMLRVFSRWFAFIFSVNEKLKRWSEKELKCKSVTFIKNFSVLTRANTNKTILKGTNGKRILCLANLRRQKDHPLLLKAFKQIHQDYPEWSLHCVGKDFKDAYSSEFFKLVDNLGLQNSVYFYNSKSDVLNIMKQCQIGALSSKSEGLPLAILEYGFSELAVITTNVGNCGELIKNSTYGILVDSGNVSQFVKGLESYINDKDYRLSCAKAFNQKVIKEYSEEAILNEVLEIYKSL